MRGGMIAAGLPLLAVAVGLTVGMNAKVAVVLLLAIIASAALIGASRASLAAALIAGTIAIPSLILLVSSSGGSSAASLLAGQGRWVTVVFAVLIMRSLLRGERIVLPSLVRTALLIYCALYALELVVAFFRSDFPPGTGSLIVRQVTYPLAAIVGASTIGGGATRDRDGRAGSMAVLRLARVAGLSAGVAGLAAFWFWAWLHGHVSAGPFEHLFSQASQASVYPGRSIFPLVQDSPNVGVVVIVALAAFSVPPLLEGSRHDKLLAATAVLAAGSAVYATESRTGVIALGVAALVWLLLNWRDRRRRATVVLLIALIAGAVQAYTLLPSSRKFQANAPTLVARQGIWKQAVSDLGRDPAFGLGYHFSAGSNFVESAAPGAAAVARGQSVQSEYLGQLVDGGLAGFVLFVFILMTWLRAARAQLGGPRRSLGVGLVCMLAGVGAAMIGSSVLQSAAVSTLVWFLFGAVAALGAVGGEEPSVALPR
jgi:O-antigen ligase